MRAKEMLQAEHKAVHRRYLRELEFGNTNQQQISAKLLEEIEGKIAECDKAATPTTASKASATAHRNAPKPTGIDWCDSTINPVVGCPRMCGAEFDEQGNMTKKPWCYGYTMANRFKDTRHKIKQNPDWAVTEKYLERLTALDSKNGKSIFMNSMSDYCYWDEETVYAVHTAINKNPQHNYIFLTKSDCVTMQAITGCNPETGELNAKKANVFHGKTVTRQAELPQYGGFDFLSVEPIFEPIIIAEFKDIRMVIIGAENGNRKGKVIPQRQWITDLVSQCDKAAVRVFMKESLRGVMGEDFRQDALIWEVKK